MLESKPMARRAAGLGRQANSDFELWAWLFMRVSGLLLLFLALGHLAIMHLLNSVDRIDYGFVAGRWSSLVWRLYDFLLLLLALLHGLNGMRVIVDDYVQSRGWRLAILSGLYTIALIFLSTGALVLFTFEPATIGGQYVPAP